MDVRQKSRGRRRHCGPIGTVPRNKVTLFFSTSCSFFFLWERGERGEGRGERGRGERGEGRGERGEGRGERGEGRGERGEGRGER